MTDEKDDKVFDVAKPGATSPSSTSKPVIVGHKNMIDDPMVKAAASATLDGVPADDKESKANKESDESVGPHQAKDIKPLNEPNEQAAESAPSEPAKPAESNATDLTNIEAAKTETADGKPAGATDSLPETETDKTAEKPDKVDEEEQAKQAAIQKLIESKQYVVHVGEAHHRKHSKNMMIVIALVVLLLDGFTAYLLK